MSSLLTLDAAASEFGVAVPWLRAAAVTGLVPALLTAGGDVLFSALSLERALVDLAQRGHRDPDLVFRARRGRRAVGDQSREATP